MKRKLAITCLVDEASTVDGDPEFRRVVRGAASAEYWVCRALRELGFTVRVYVVGDSVEDLVRELSRSRPDVVFNLTEVFRWDRRLDLNIVALLELMDIPYTGAAPRGLMLSRDKALSKGILAAEGIDVPRWTVCKGARDARVPRGAGFPLIVKPLLRDGSEGIGNRSIVTTPEHLRRRVAMIAARTKEPVIVEEYIEGRELYVSVIGERALRVLPPRELHVASGSSRAPRIATYMLKWNKAYRKKWAVTFRAADLDPLLCKRVTHVCRRAFAALCLRDYARIDLRITPQGRVVVLEANANPNLAGWCDVGQSAERAGISYNALIGSMVRAALKRAQSGKRRAAG